MARFGLDLRAGLPQLAAGLVGGVIAYRYIVRPAVRNESDDASHRPLAAAPSSSRPLSSASVSPASASIPSSASVFALDSLESLDRVGRGRVAILFARGYPPGEVAKAKKAFLAAAASSSAKRGSGQDSSISSSGPVVDFVIVDDASAQAPATTLQTRLGITHEKPFVMILDRFIETERKFLMTTPEIPSASEVETFVAHFRAGKLQPALLGQPRPPRDRSAACPSLVEVVTESFHELVLDPQADVLLESYTRSCDACKAFGPRYRMLAQLAEKHMPALRVAAMDILDNDREMEHLPEKWTPALRLFPAVAGAQTGSGKGKGKGKGKWMGMDAAPAKKPSILLQYNNNNSSSGSSSGGGSQQDADATSPPSPAKVYLPTLPELLSFIERGTGGRLAPSPAFRAEAEKAEADAADLESAYDQTLQYMRLWQAYKQYLEDRAQSAARSSSSSTRARDEEERRKSAEKLQSLVVDAYGYIVEHAALGGVEPAMQRLDRVAEWVEKRGISKELSAAAAAVDAATQGRGQGEGGRRME
jgi:hypothetical protein